jgi:putative mRNA 3-end processing factor
VNLVELKVRQLGGILIEYGDQGIMLDPTRNTHSFPTFVSHAHADHAAAFKHPEREKYATQETYDLLSILGWNRLDGFTKTKIGDKIKLDDIEVHILNSGHVLGSVQFEVITPEGTILYTGDLGTEKTFTMEPATPAECDIIVIETTFGSPMFKFPKREEVAVEIYQWAVNTVIKGRVPTFKTDSIGNAQEIISILNQYTNIPVVTNKSATKVTHLYRENGYNLDSIDARSDEGKELLETRKCALITPKGSKPKWDDLDIALASGWATIMGRKRIAFPLSDHADFRGLISHIRKCKPKRVLTFHGGNFTKDFHIHVRKRLGIDAAPLTNRFETLKGTMINSDIRIKACSRQIINTIKIPGFIYKPSWLKTEMKRRGFSLNETENSIDFLIERGILKGTREGVQLKRI